MAQLQDKTAIITGGASGMGLATVRRFLEEGANVVIADIGNDPSDDFTASERDRLLFVTCDVKDEAAIAAACEATAARFGTIDILFNNAGYLGTKDGVETITAEGWDDTFSGLLRGPVLFMRYALPWLKRQGGSVINTASIAGVDIGWGPMAYSVAKHGLLYLTRWAAAELSEHNIRVNAISPGLILTPLLGVANGMERGAAAAMVTGNDALSAAARFQPIRRAGQGQDIAEAALYLASNASAFVTGINLPVDGGVTIGERHVWDKDAAPPTSGLREALNGPMGVAG